MMTTLFRIFLMLSSLCMTFAVFLANKNVVLFNKLHPILINTPRVVSYLLYFIVAILLAKASLFFAKRLSDDSISKKSLSDIEVANDTYVPIYLGYFFVALSVQSYWIFLFVFGMIFIFTFLSQTSYFNPLYLLFGYRFYYVTNQSNVKVPALVHFEKIKRINDYTFIDI